MCIRVRDIGVDDKAVVNELEIGVVCNGYQQGSKHIHEYGKENRMRAVSYTHLTMIYGGTLRIRIRKS